MLDLVLAILHHLLIFSLFGVLAAEFTIIRPGMTIADVRWVAGVDIWYGVLAGLIVVVGFSRAIFAAKGWDYYSHNLFFWAKLSAFAVVGVLSIRPTIRIIGWNRSLQTGRAVVPTSGDIATLRRYLWFELAVFALIPIFAAAMARGYLL